MKSSHRKSYVWLVRAGGRGVMGIKLEELNQLIDEWNNHPCPLLDFWEWLSLDLDDCIRGFDVIWNQGNPLMSYVHIIKRKVVQMDNFPNRSYISVRLCSLAEDIKAHTALTEDDEKIVLCCLNEIKCLIELNRKCYEYNMNGVRNE